MANQYVSSVAYAAVAQWAANTVVAVGQIVRQLAVPAVGDERCWVCTTAGTTGGAEPTWTLTKSSTTNDNGVVWTEITGQEAYQAPGNWAAPFARLVTPATTTGFRATAGTNIFIAADHSESTAASVTFGNNSGYGENPVLVVCIDSGAGSHVPPLGSDVATGASVITTGFSSSITFSYSGGVFVGIKFIAGSGAGGVGTNLTLATPTTYSQSVKFINSILGTGATSGGGLSFVGSASGSAVVELINTQVSFPSINTNISLSNVVLIWRDTPNALLGAVPTSANGLFAANSYNGARSTIICDGVDLSAMGSGATLLGNQSNCGTAITLRNCLLKNRNNPGGAGFNGFSGSATPFLYTIDAINCDVGGQTYSHSRWSIGDYLLSESLVVRTGGASDGATPIGWSILRGQNNTSWSFPFEAFPISVWNATVGSSVNVTFYGVWNSGSLPNNDEIWQDIEYYGSSGSTRGYTQSGTKANVLASGTPLDASTEAWDSGLGARANSTAYTTNSNPIRVASNPGRIFFCTTNGTSAASEPAGYATAVDGGSVTDGTAVFRAGVRFQQTLSVTPQNLGLISSVIKVATNSQTFYVDPKLNIQ